VVDDVNMLLRREIDRHVADALVRDAAERANRFPYSGNVHRDFITDRTDRDEVQDERTQGVLNPIVADAEARAERARKASFARDTSRTNLSKVFKLSWRPSTRRRTGSYST
jgi:hypothetical protein